MIESKVKELANILVFGGTTEARLLIEYLERNKQKAYVCVATEYGKEILGKTTYCKVIVGRKTKNEIEQLLIQLKIEKVLDATHPYALEISSNIKWAVKRCQISYYRILRDLGEKEDGVFYFSTIEEMKAYLNQAEGNFVSTLGYKELPLLEGIRHLSQRGFVRILPGNNEEELQALCKKIDFCRSHIIESRGPFSISDNEKMLLRCNAQFCLTKETGKEGGFPEKVIATKQIGAKLLVLERPKENQGITLQECFTLLAREE